MSSTRESTLRHLKHMVAAAAVLGCEKPEASIDKDRTVDGSSTAATSDARDANVADASDASLLPDASDASIADASVRDASRPLRIPPACPPGGIRAADGTCGYMVVDPIPRPARTAKP